MQSGVIKWNTSGNSYLFYFFLPVFTYFLKKNVVKLIFLTCCSPLAFLLVISSHTLYHVHICGPSVTSKRNIRLANPYSEIQEENLAKYKEYYKKKSCLFIRLIWFIFFQNFVTGTYLIIPLIPCYGCSKSYNSVFSGWNKENNPSKGSSGPLSLTFKGSSLTFKDPCFVACWTYNENALISFNSCGSRRLVTWSAANFTGIWPEDPPYLKLCLCNIIFHTSYN